MVENQNCPERYSFSKLSAFYTCKLGYKFRYIDHEKGEGNSFSSYGKLLHALLERYIKGEIGLWNLTGVYEWEFETAVPEEFPPLPRRHEKYGFDMRQLYYDQGLSFLKNFPGYPHIKILEVESEFDLEIDDWIFNGVIDLVFEDKTGIVIEDHKSKSSFKTKTEQAEYARQLYLYSLQIKKKYGRYPYKLCFNMVRKQKKINIPFNIRDLEEAVAWAKGAVSAIRAAWDYPPAPDAFFCNNLCNHRSACEFRCKESG